MNALRGNLAWMRHRIGAFGSIMTVVKADAYGHGLRQIAALLMQVATWKAIPATQGNDECWELRRFRWP